MPLEMQSKCEIQEKSGRLCSKEDTSRIIYMGLKEFLWKTVKWKYMKNHLGYNDEQMEHFKTNPKNEEFLSRAPYLMSKMVIAEVVDSHGCNSQHKVGDKFYFDGFGNLLTERSPKKICIYALNAIVPQIFAVTELLRADANPNEMRFNRAACIDVGVQCGGVGRIVVEVKVIDMEKA